MKILALSDRTPDFSIQERAAAEGIDLICTLGDLYHPDIRELAAISDIPKIGVYGNHCSGTYMGPLGITNLHLHTVQIQGVTLGGFQGCVRYKPNPDAIMCTQEEADAMMADFPPVDVMISHCPPYGINDEPEDVTHQGFHALRHYLEQFPPRLWLHGHTYPDPPIEEFGSTRIEYVYRSKIIEL